MICLDNTDTLEGGASVDAVVDFTVHVLVGGVFANLAQGQLSNTDPSVLYTAAAAISIVSVVFVNTHNAAVTVNLYLDPANAATPRRMIPKNLSLAAGYSMHFDGQRLTILDTDGKIQSSPQAPAAHHTSHENAGDDAIQLDNLAAPDDNTDLDASITKHGLMPKGDNNITHFYRSDGTQAAPPGSKIVQVVNYETGAVATGTTLVPHDDTIPQNTEGNQYMSLSITPTNANNKLLIEVVWYGTNSFVGDCQIVAALFQDTTANALASMSARSPGQNLAINLKFSHYMTANTTSSTTFKVRAGSNEVGTITFNGIGGNRYFGGSLASSITITEIAA